MAQRARSGRHFHAVQFYQDDESLISVVARFLADGLKQRQPAIAITTPAHRIALEDALTEYGLDVRRLKQLGDIVLLDARETLETMLIDGMPHPQLFHHVVDSMFKEIVRIHPNRTTRAYGEMVNVLWQDGMPAAAIRLEMLWNELAKSHDFQLLCGYSMDNLYKDAAVGEITRQHTHVLAETGEVATIN